MLAAFPKFAVARDDHGALLRPVWPERPPADGTAEHSEWAAATELAFEELAAAAIDALDEVDPDWCAAVRRAERASIDRRLARIDRDAARTVAARSFADAASSAREAVRHIERELGTSFQRGSRSGTRREAIEACDARLGLLGSERAQVAATPLGVAACVDAVDDVRLRGVLRVLAVDRLGARLSILVEEAAS